MKDTILIEKFLSDELDLSKKEINLYLNLVKYGSLTILELSEITGINRATTHINVENLAQKGLITQIKKGRGSRRLIMAEPPEKISMIFKERKAKLESAENQLGFIAKEISSLKQEYKPSGGMEIRRYEGKDEVKLIYNDVLKAKEIRAYVNYEKLSKIFPSNTFKFLDTHRKNANMQIWEIMEDSIKAQEYAKMMPKERYFFRFATDSLKLAAIDYILFDGKIAIIELSSNAGISGIIIENENFYKNAKAIYKFVWGCLPIHNK